MCTWMSASPDPLQTTFELTNKRNGVNKYARCGYTAAICPDLLSKNKKYHIVFLSWLISNNTVFQRFPLLLTTTPQVGSRFQDATRHLTLSPSTHNAKQPTTQINQESKPIRNANHPATQTKKQRKPTSKYQKINCKTNQPVKQTNQRSKPTRNAN